MSHGKFPALRSAYTSQSPSHTRLNSQRPSFSKTNTPAVRFKDDLLSPTDTHKASERSSPLLSPLLKFEETDAGNGLVPRPVDISLDPGVDGVFDQALVRLDQLLDRQAQKSHMKKLQLLGGGKSNQSVGTTASAKNQQIVQRVTKYKNIKGINPKTKEVRFEERLSTFKDIKTFVDIRKIVKDMGSPVGSAHVHSGNVSSGTPKVNLMVKLKNAPVLEGFNEMYEQIESEQSPIPTPGSSKINPNAAVFITSPMKRHSANNEFFSSLHSKLRDVADKDFSMIASTVAPENHKYNNDIRETPEVSEKIQEAHKKIEEQLKKYMGPKIRSKLGKALQNKDVFERIVQRKQDSLHQMRETQKDLSDLDAFHTLMDLLSEKDVSKEADTELDLAKDEGPDTFYTKLEKNILRQEEKDDEFADGRGKGLTYENQETEMDEKTTYEMDNLPNNLLEDEQIRIMTTLQAYKKRSDKIIQILKKKTRKLQQEVVLKKSAVVKEKLSSVLKTVPTIKETTEEHVGGTIASAIGLRSDSLASKGRASLFRTSIRLRSLDHMPDIKRETPTWEWQSRKASETGSRLEFEHKVKENKKKFIEIQEKKKKSFHMTQYGSRKSWLSKIEDSAGSLGSFYNSGYDEKFSSQKNNNFNKSLKRICGDVSEVLTNSKSLNTEMKRTIVERDKYFSGKVREITDQEVPEALVMQKRPDFTHKKAKFIMNLTKHLLKER